MLQVRDLNIRYRRGNSAPHDAVREVSFEIAAGEVVGLMGESGCGKSSIALALLGLLNKTKTEISGSILFRSQEILAMGERQLQEIRGTGISMIYQEPGIALSPVMRVGQQVAEVIHAHNRWGWKRCYCEAEEMLARVGLTQTDRIFKAYPHQLSGGQRQRIVLAQALTCNPALLIADEPTASLDARSQAGFVELLRKLRAERQLSILLISHTPEIQASLADRLLVMRGGQIVESGIFESIYASSADPYTRSLLGQRSCQRVKAADAERRQPFTEPALQ